MLKTSLMNDMGFCLSACGFPILQRIISSKGLELAGTRASCTHKNPINPSINQSHTYLLTYLLKHISLPHTHTHTHSHTSHSLTHTHTLTHSHKHTHSLTSSARDAMCPRTAYSALSTFPFTVSIDKRDSDLI
jgi:hypothetical protein